MKHHTINRAYAWPLAGPLCARNSNTFIPFKGTGCGIGVGRGLLSGVPVGCGLGLELGLSCGDGDPFTSPGFGGCIWLVSVDGDDKGDADGETEAGGADAGLAAGVGEGGACCSSFASVNLPIGVNILGKNVPSSVPEVKRR